MSRARRLLKLALEENARSAGNAENLEEEVESPCPSVDEIDFLEFDNNLGHHFHEKEQSCEKTDAAHGVSARRQLFKEGTDSPPENAAISSKHNLGTSSFKPLTSQHITKSSCTEALNNSAVEVAIESNLFPPIALEENGCTCHIICQSSSPISKFGAGVVLYSEPMIEPTNEEPEHVSKLTLGAHSTPSIKAVDGIVLYSEPSTVSNANAIEAPGSLSVIDLCSQAHSVESTNMLEDILCGDIAQDDVSAAPEHLSVSDPGPQAQSTPSNKTCRRRAREVSTGPVRKRSRNEPLWKRNINKTLKNLGQPYETSKGKHQEAVKMRDPCSCSFDCRHLLTHEQRLQVHQTFWNLGDHNRQWEFIRMNSSCKPTTPQPEQESKRKVCRTYHFIVDGKKTKVCKQMFMRTLSISDSWIDSAYRHVNPEKGNTVSPDKRGGHRKGKLVTMSQAKVDSVKEHVKLFPRIPSHYCRKRTQREYLEKGLSINKMAKMYSKWAEEEHLPKAAVATQRQYRDIVNENFNIGFYMPKKDQCSFCSVMKNKSNTRNIREEKKEAWVAHLKNKKLSRGLKDKDKSEGMKDKSVAVVSFDLQKQLSCPKSENSAYYYRSKLNIYNFTAFNMVEREGVCYVWHEGIGKKGSDDICSALYNYIEELILKGYRDFRLWSDNCSGQNKNRNLFAMYELLAVKHSIKITHRYLETGHTQMEADSIHANIERSVDKEDIFDFDGWVEKIENAKSTLPKYKVVKLTQNIMFSFKTLVEKQNWEFDLKRQKVKWTKIKELHIDGNEGNLVRLKYAFDCDSYVTLSPNKPGHPVNLKTFQPPRAYDGPIPLSTRTITDLRWLCDNFHIPLMKQDFIKNVLDGVYPVEEDQLSENEIDSEEEIFLEDLEGEGRQEDV